MSVTISHISTNVPFSFSRPSSSSFDPPHHSIHQHSKLINYIPLFEDRTQDNDRPIIGQQPIISPLKASRKRQVYIQSQINAPFSDYQHIQVQQHQQETQETQQEAKVKEMIAHRDNYC